MSNDFIAAIENNDIEALRKIPKSDLHNHGTRGGNKKYIEEWTGKRIAEPSKFESLADMQIWYDVNIKPLCQGQLGFVKRIEAAFRQAVYDGIKVLCMSFGIGDSSNFNGSIKEYVEAIEKIHTKIAPDIRFIPEICFIRTNNINDIEREFDEILSIDYFKSIDIVGNDTESVDNFKEIYRRAKKNNMILKAHLGEFGDAHSIRRAIDILELDQIQHGINASQSIEVMKELAKRKIQLNICPTSNILLCRTESYKTHPIRKLIDYGVKVTINTDDMLIFNQSVSNEYLNLYKTGNFTAIELDNIRKQGLS